jgi:hypothetical protein
MAENKISAKAYMFGFFSGFAPLPQLFTYSTHV